MVTFEPVSGQSDQQLCNEHLGSECRITREVYVGDTYLHSSNIGEN